MMMNADLPSNPGPDTEIDPPSIIRNPVKLALKGMAMGIAEVIPGVSGGTIALITGIYETLINTIKSVDLTLLKLLASLKIKAGWQHINGPFLLCLVSGMLVGIVVGVFGVSHLMDRYPEELWGFFFGLILASAIYIGKSVASWNLNTILSFVIGVILAYFLTTLAPVSGSTELAYVFVCGAIAICALILPGISGSFVLLLLGMYTTIIPTVRHFLTTFDLADLSILVVFGLGCAVGLMSFSRVLSWMFKRYRQVTLGLLTGVMIGSLNKIWPWRNPTSWMDENGNVLTELLPGADVKILSEVNVMPASYTLDNPNTAIVIVCVIAGFALVFVMDRFFSERTATPNAPI